MKVDKRITEYLLEHPEFELNKNSWHVTEVMARLRRNEVNFKDAYCPCRAKREAKNVCPCEDFRKTKKCHCRLFVLKGE